MQEIEEHLRNELGREPTEGELEEAIKKAAADPSNEQGFEFDVIGVQINMRRYPIKGDVRPVTVSIGGHRVQTYACTLVDPATNDDDPPDLMDVLIPTDMVTMFVIRKREPEEDELEAAAKREAEADEAVPEPIKKVPPVEEVP